MDKIFFDNWDSLFRTLIITVLAYFILILFLRVSGKRTLSKMNAFDLIITIGLGSTLATVILDKNVPLADGALAFFLLIFLQFLLTWLSVRSKWISNLIKSAPSLLVYKGAMLKKEMRKARIDEDEIYAIIRKNGLSSLTQVDVIVLETDGSLTLIPVVEDVNTKPMKNLNKE